LYIDILQIISDGCVNQPGKVKPTRLPFNRRQRISEQDKQTRVLLL